MRANFKNNDLSDPDTTTQDWFTPKRFLILLALCIFAAFPEVVTGIATFVYRDYGIFSYPNAYYLKQCFWRGEIPFWNPLNNCGVPFLAQWNTQALYPPALFYLLLPLEWSLPIFNLIHLFFAGIGMYLLLNLVVKNRLGAVIGSITYCFSGIAINSVMWQSNIAAMGWAPWFIAAVYQYVKRENQKLHTIIITGTMQLLAGSPEITAATYIIAAALVLPELFKNKTKILPLAICAVAMALLTAAQMFPFLGLVNESNRGGRFVGYVWNMPVYGWANFFVPLFHFYHSEMGVFLQYNQCWTSSYYCGLFIILVSIFAALHSKKLHTLLLVFLFLLGVALAMGMEGLLYKPAISLIPALKMMRYPVKFLIISVMAAPFLAAEGISLLCSARNNLRSTNFKNLLLIVFIGLIASCLILFDNLIFPLARDNWNAIAYNSFERWVLCASAIIAIYGIIKNLKCHRLLQLLLPVVIFIDLFTHNPIQNPTIQPWVYEPDLTKSEWKKDPALIPLPEPGVSRVFLRPNDDQLFGHVYMRDLVADYLASRLFLFCNCNLLENIPKADGFFPLDIKRYFDFYFLLRRKDGNIDQRFLDIMSISHINEDGKFFHFQRRENFFPLVTIGYKPLFADPPEIFQLLTSSNFNPRGEVLLPSDLKEKIKSQRDENSQVKMISFSSHKIEFETTCEKPTIVFISQAFYKNWKAFIGGKQIPVYPANFAFTAIEAPAGKHTVVLRYIDTAFFAGFALSVLALLSISLLILYQWKKSIAIKTQR
ncbi:MAG: YfhO family protein [Verrucomicrobiia bacterium]|jgi:hypothetical protein